jgi:serine phosphatase RsbU (regulator of sigma subunit)
MPFITPPTHRRDGQFEWAWKSVPHVKEVVSGDALFIEVDRSDGRLMFLLIDVMDHGPKAAFVVDLFRRLYLWDAAVQERQPRELLYNLSSLIAHHYSDGGGPSSDLTERERDAAKERHTCALAGLLDPESGRMSLAAAQQPDPYHLSVKEGTWQPLAVSSHVALGWPVEVDSADDPGLFSPVTIDLEPGDRLIAMTDGITQSRFPGDAGGGVRRWFFVLDGLERALADMTGVAVPAGQIGRLFEAVETYAGQGWPDDDSTAVIWCRADAVVAQETQKKMRLPENHASPPRFLGEPIDF